MVELFIFIEILSRGLYNPFYTNVSFLYPLKMSETPGFLPFSGQGVHRVMGIMGIMGMRN